MEGAFGRKIDIRIYGESHAEEIGVEIDGLPAGASFDADELQRFLVRRAPGAAGGADAPEMLAALAELSSTPRREKDLVEFGSGVSKPASGVYDGANVYELTGERVSAYIVNRDRRSGDYDTFRRVLRPGHADLGAYYRYGIAGPRPGGGRFSGRMTAPLCIAGGIAKQLLAQAGIEVKADISEIAGETDMRAMAEAVSAAAADGDSVGGVVSCVVSGFPPGIGGALFDGIESAISQAVFAIPAAKGIEFGSGFAGSRMRGSENNDAIVLCGGVPVTETNNHGGIAGGISTGMDICFETAFKPTPTIGRVQRSVDIAEMAETKLNGKGRHDVCIVPRAVPVVEAAASLALLDIMLEDGCLGLNDGRLEIAGTGFKSPVQEPRRYALIGKGISHSFSELIHRVFSASGDFGNYGYELINADNDEELRRALGDSAYSGFNITMPYKCGVIRHLDDISFDAMSMDAVNTVTRNSCGRLIGDNTDLYGFKSMVGEEHIEGRSCLILGTGGASAAVYRGLVELGASEVIMASRASEKGVSYDRIASGEAKDALACEVIVNTTPVGMFPDAEAKPPVDVRMFGNLEFVADIIYNPNRTRLLQEAEDMGVEVKSGLEMLVRQGLRAAEIWHGRNLSEKRRDELAARACAEILSDRLNIVAVGMPGSGKSSISRRIARIIGREFIDTDRLTEKKLGHSISDDIEMNGEEHFRAAETEAVREACSKRGAVIATGGGSVLSDINRMNLRAYGVIIYIRRPTDKLTKKNRPVTAASGVEKLYDERAEIYEGMADITIENAKTFGESVGKVGRRNSYNYDMNRFAYSVIAAIREKTGIDFTRGENRK